MPNPTVITLCGSITRAHDELVRLAWHLNTVGHLVYVPLPPPDGVTPTDEQINHLNAGHRAAIDRSDLVIVVVPDGRIGESTTAEAAYATQQGKPVRMVGGVDAYVREMSVAPTGASQ